MKQAVVTIKYDEEKLNAVKQYMGKKDADFDAELKEVLGIPDEKFVFAIENYGNTVSSTIPIALYDMEREGRLVRGDKVLIVGFGVGLSWGGTVLKWFR